MTKQIPVALKGTTRMSTKNSVSASLIVAMLVTFVSQTQAVTFYRATEQPPVEQAIVGNWLSQIPSGSKFIATFHQGGTVHITGQFDINGTTNVVLSPRQGVWKYLGGRQFGVTVLAVRCNPLATTTTPPVAAGSLIGYTKIDYLLRLSEDGDRLTGMNRASTIDPNGNVVSVTTNDNMPSYERIKLASFQ